MPKTDKRGEPKSSELPGTLRRSDEHAQEIFAEAHDSALEQYGSEQRAHRVAYAALKHSYEKVGDHWEAKQSRGPSDERAEHGGPNPRGETAEGVDANASKQHLREIATRLEISGRSKMTKDQLVDAIRRYNERARRRAGGRKTPEASGSQR
ncbi:cation transport regulator [Nocardia otitidiscaviarum]|uniref:Cation transport regulator n=1 Tax=Nocardia otitidiscaviarum TaxID=1823 RepID=A0A379JL61_9NOCA|nr:ChaB family protein [Nocardia otitidiscaviarum]SUD49086.1 cation transport regulator [Nocardia otitidiscaviarum]